MKSEGKSIKAISTQAHGEVADNLREEFSRQIDSLTSEFEARLAAKQNEINALKGGDGGEGVSGTSNCSDF